MRKKYGLLLIAVSLALEVSAEDVIIAPPMTRVVPTVEQLRNVCGAAGQFDACTRFIGYRLTTTCRAEADQWKIEVSATFRPWMVLLNVRKIPHELEHVADVEKRLAAYAGRIEQRRFESSAACTSAGALESSLFGATMKQLAEESNLAMHPTAVDPAVVRAAHGGTPASER